MVLLSCCERGFEKFTLRRRSANLKDSCCSEFVKEVEVDGGKKGAFAAMFFSEGLRCCPWSSSSDSGSTGVGRSDRGRFADEGLRGLIVGIGTGEGESEGLFSSFSISLSLDSSVIWGLETGALIERDVESAWAIVR